LANAKNRGPGGGGGGLRTVQKKKSPVGQKKNRVVESETGNETNEKPHPTRNNASPGPWGRNDFDGM